jgi:methionyl-tRNA formyltransferase
MVDTGGLRIVFFGTPDFAVPSLEALLRSRHQVVGVVTQPDRPRGRGQKTTDGPVKAHAMAAGLPLLQPARLKDDSFLAALAALRADLGVVAAYGKILTDEVLAAPRLGMINVHASLLPRYRGAAPIHRAVMAGETETGVTIMRVVKALDAGPMLAKVTRAIGPDDTSDEIERDLAARGADLVVATIEALAEDRARETSQIDSEATYAHRLTKEDGLVHWDRSAVEIHDQIRGLHPWPHAFSFARGQRVILHRSALGSPSDAAGVPGTVLEAAGDRLVVATGAGPLQLLIMQAEGKRPLAARDFLAGHPLTPGDRFTSAP